MAANRTQLMDEDGDWSEVTFAMNRGAGGYSADEKAAATVPKLRAEEYPEEKIDQVLNVNLKTPLMLSRICYPYLKESEYAGRIVTISSMAAYMGFSGVLPYDMSKSGVLGLTRGLAEEWKNDNILVNSVAPGWFLTRLNAVMFEKNPDRKEAALGKPMLRRFGDPKEIGYMVLFLLSGASRYITGCDFPVDGGATAHGF